MRITTIDRLKDLDVIEKICILVYFFIALVTMFYYKIVGNINEFWLLYTIIVCYFVNVTYFFSKIINNNIYTEKYSIYIKIHSMQILGLWVLLVIRLNLSLTISMCLATVFLFFIVYSRSYLVIEEFFRLTSASISLCFQIYFQADLIVSLFSLIFIIIYGRLTSEFIDKFILLDKYLLNYEYNIQIFYLFLDTYIKISNLRLGKRAIMFNYLLFTILPTIWIFFFFNRVYVPLFVMFFMSILLVSSSVYVKFIRNPLLSVRVFNHIKKKYPKDFQKKMDKISKLVLIKENYYVIDSLEYGVFSGSWLVKNYIDIKQNEFKYWATCFLDNYISFFVEGKLGYHRDDIDTIIDDFIIEGLIYIKETGNMEKNDKTDIYGKGVQLLVDNSSVKEIKFLFWKEMFERLLKTTDDIDSEFLKAVWKFEELNKDKGLNVESFLRSPGSSYFVSNNLITVI